MSCCDSNSLCNSPKEFCCDPDRINLNKRCCPKGITWNNNKKSCNYPKSYTPSQWSRIYIYIAAFCPLIGWLINKNIGLIIGIILSIFFVVINIKYYKTEKPIFEYNSKYLEEIFGTLVTNFPQIIDYLFIIIIIYIVDIIIILFYIYFKQKNNKLLNPTKELIKVILGTYVALFIGILISKLI